MFEKKYCAMNAYIIPRQALVDQTERRMKEMYYCQAAHTSQKSRTKMVLVLAMLVLLLGATAYAITQSALLTYLFHGRDVNPETQRMIQPVTAATEDKGVTFAVNEYIRSDDRLMVSYTIESKLKDAVFVSAESFYYIDEGGTKKALGSPLGGLGSGHQLLIMLGGMLEGQTVPQTRSMVTSFDWPQMLSLQKSIVVHADIHVWQAKNPPVLWSGEEDASPWQLWREQHLLGVYPETHQVDILKYAISNPTEFWPDDMAAYYEEQGYVKALARLDTSFTVNNTAFTEDSSQKGQPNVFEYDTHTLSVGTMEFTQSRTYIAFDVHFKGGSKDYRFDNPAESQGMSAEERDPLRNIQYGLWDAAGNDLLEKYAGRGGVSTLKYGTSDEYLEYMFSCDALEQMPTEVVIAPIVQELQSDGTYRKMPKQSEMSVVQIRKEAVSKKRVFDLGTYTLYVRALEFSPIQTYMIVDVYPKRALKPETIDTPANERDSLRAMMLGIWDIYDDVHPLSTSTGKLEVDDDGVQYIRFESISKPVSKLPSKIILAPETQRPSANGGIYFVPKMDEHVIVEP